MNKDDVFLEFFFTDNFQFMKTRRRIINQKEKKQGIFFFFLY